MHDPRGACVVMYCLLKYTTLIHSAIVRVRCARAIYSVHVLDASTLLICMYVVLITQLPTIDYYNSAAKSSAIPQIPQHGT